MARLIVRLKQLRRSDDQITAQVRAVLVESLYASRQSLIIGALTSTAIAAVVSSTSKDAWLIVCAILIGLVGFVRIVDAVRLHRQELAEGPRGPGTAGRHELFYRLGALSYSGLLGLFGLLTLIRTDDGVLQLLSVTTAIGYAAGIAGRNAGRPWIALSQLCCASLPLALGLLIAAEPLKVVLAVVIVLFVVAMMDITLQTYGAILRATVASHEKAALAEHHAAMARRDDLTGVANRTAFREEFEARLRALGSGEGKLALHWLDLDRFKEVNDSFGHLAGNALLVAVAQRLREQFGAPCVVARLGGDEFAIVCAVGDDREAVAIGYAVLDLVKQTVAHDGHTLRTSASIGVAIAPQDGRDADTLLRNADLALYRAKESGGGQFSFYEPEMDEKIERRRQLGAELHGALERGEFQLVFQPIFRLADERITSCEVLLRWTNRRFGAVSPAEFIPIAEDSGQIVEIGSWVLFQACQAARDWPAGISIAVNLSPIQLRSANLPAVVARALDQSGLPAGRLQLEVTESVLLEDVDASIAALEALNRIGVCTTLDDFGTGYSSLSYLTRFPFQTIKIDRSFISDLDRSPASIAIVQTVVDLAAKLGMRTVAEGIETEAQLAQLRRTRCDAVQGYLLAKPMPANMVGAMLAGDALETSPDA
ncbi:putative bifunctional diguanylate cyclase/phosphodiesterase [Sphingomonas desiccabilis]|uniref:EAL domain-containing protein n=1 Tax=Sphingomonas desiccabilis TaxID=429134 RepID=A0A4Q2IT57_9SPHN|nr:EAL domain-containing protein [Sphingomonas desiccabilis]MBB3911477.1 diguanylate cyclase (GGDEF)-like protein [Sphingomonas desiccabilis]RXZ31755.1 EAL domain-containing protein [Sphingomonas desiccabilis]